MALRTASLDYRAVQLLAVTVALLELPSRALSQERGSARSEIPPKCDAELLARTPVFDSSRATELPGRFRWIYVDTVSDRKPLRLSPELLARAKPLPTEFQLWLRDSSVRVDREPTFPHLEASRSLIGGALLGFDSTGFNGYHPQITAYWGPYGAYLNVSYDPRVGRGLIDGGDVAETLPIDVLGTWGFGGYYERLSQFRVRDLDGDVIRPFAGFYCAMRIPEARD